MMDVALVVSFYVLAIGLMIWLGSHLNSLTASIRDVAAAIREGREE